MNKKTVILANIGNSDIGKDTNPLFNPREVDIYKESEKLYNSGDFYDLDLLLLEPVILNIKKDKDYMIEKIYLFSTEQEPVHRQDTKYIGEIVKKIICKRHGFDEHDVKNIIVNRNPSDYDSMFKYYGDEIMNLKVNPDIIYVSITGGTQQQNMSLLLSTVSRFGMLTHAVYVPRGMTEVKEYLIGSLLYNKFLMHRIEELEKRQFYGAAADVAENFGVLNVNEINLLRAKAKRDLFDFEGSLGALKEIKNNLPEKREEITKAINELEKLTKEDEKERIIELYRNMKVRWEQGAYADFIGRLFRFEEAVLRYIVEEKYNISTEKDKERGFTEFVEFVNANEELKKFLSNAKIDIKNIEPNRRTLFMILRYLSEKDEKLKELKTIIGKVENLGEIRNKSILAHGFDGVSREKINNKYKSGDLIKDIEEIVKFILQPAK